MRRTCSFFLLAAVASASGCARDAAGSPNASSAEAVATSVPGPSADSVPSCDGVPLVTSDSLGPIRIGMTRAAVLARCPMAKSDIEFAEGDPHPILAVSLGGANLTIYADGDSASAPVYRVLTQSELAKTAEGIGPGTTLSAVSGQYGPLSFGVAECALATWSPVLAGISWTVQMPADWDCIQLSSVGTPGGAVLPDSTRITGVFVRR